MSNTYNDLLKALPRSDAEYPAAQCPNCGSTGLSYQYFGVDGSAFGSKLIWCNRCKIALNISRTKIPSEAAVLTGEEDQRVFASQHKDLKLVF